MNLKTTAILCLVFSLGIHFNFQAQGKYASLQPSDLEWNLNSLYDASKSWDEQIETLRKELHEISKLKGLIVQNHQNLEMVLDKVSTIRGKAAKLVVYSALNDNLDYTSSTAQQHFLSALEIEDEIEAATSFINQEVGAISEDELVELLSGNDNLRKHRKRINRIQDEKPYRMSYETEKVLLGMKRLWLQSGQTHQAIFENEKLDWPGFELPEGDETKLTLGKFLGLRRNTDFSIRTSASATFLEYLERYKDILAIQLTKRIEIELQIGKLRGFETGIDSEFLLRDGFPSGATQVFRNSALQNKNLVLRYCSAMSRLNGRNSPHYSDIYVGTSKVNKTFSLGESIDIVYQATANFGDVYKKKIDSLLLEPTFHFKMQENKRIMWAIYPPVGGAKPYTIMPYDGSFRASSVLSRAIVGNLAQHHYNPDTRDDPPVYNNGIIYVGSLLHRDYLVNQSETDQERLTFLQAAVYGLYNTFFKYAVYASFESEIEQRLIQGQTPNGDDVSKIYYNVLRKYFGDEIEIPEVYANEWMTIAQPFNTYEHQYWPVAMAAACNIMENLQEPSIKNLLVGKVTERSDRSYQILKDAGIDLMDVNSYQALFDRMSGYLNEIELLIDKK